MCVCLRLHLRAISPKRGRSWNLTCCQGYVSIIFSRLHLWVAMIDSQRIGFLLFLWTCLSIAFHFSLPSKFNLTYIKRLTPSPFVAEGNQFKVIEL